MTILIKFKGRTDFSVSENGIVEAIGNGQHVFERHVGLTDAQLFKRLEANPRISGASTFTDDITANYVVLEALLDSKNIEKITNWLSQGAQENLQLFYKGETIIGRGIQKGSTIMDNMLNAKVILKSNEVGWYNILTAFPTK